MGIPVASRLALSEIVVWRSLWALLPLLLFLAFAVRTRWAPLARLHQQVSQLVRQVFAGVPWWGLAAVALAAGVGEEAMFRGALQPIAERWLGAALGLAVVSVAFGAVHAMSIGYFALATLVGAYLGWLAQYFDDLVAPMFVHAAYDFVALLVLLRGVGDRGPVE